MVGETVDPRHVMVVNYWMYTKDASLHRWFCVAWRLPLMTGDPLPNF